MAIDSGLWLAAGIMILAFGILIVEQRKIDKKMTSHHEYKVVRGIVIKQWRSGK